MCTSVSSPMTTNEHSLVCVECVCYCSKENLWPESQRKESPEEPSWVQTEKEHFRSYRDKDNDGKLNKVI